MEIVLRRLVQIGVVMSVDNEKHTARVKFPDTEIISDWLHVLDNRPYINSYDIPLDDVPNGITEEEGGGSGDPAFEEHAHDLIIRQWMPKVNDVVLCLYLPMRNSDGFILGGIK